MSMIKGIFVLVFLINVVTPVNATTNNTISETQLITEDKLISSYFTEEDRVFINDLTKIYQYFEINSDGLLSLSRSIESLIEEYNFTDDFSVRLTNLLDLNSIQAGGKLVSSRIFVSNWRIYFTYNDVMSTLFAAAQIGPAAIVAALTAIGSLYPGLGTTFGFVIGLLGGSYITYYVLQAGINRQGMYIGVDWNGVFPNPAIGNW